MVIIAVWSLMGKNLHLKSTNVNFPTQFYFGSISEIYDYADSGEVSFKGNTDDFSVDYDAIDKVKF